MDTEEFVIPQEILDDTDVLCLFGFDPAKLEKQLESWNVSQDKEVVFIEREDFDQLEAFIKLSQKKVFQRFSYLIAPFLEERNHLILKELSTHYQTVQWNVHLEASDFQDFGLKVFRNLCANHTKKADVNTFVRLKDSLKGMPAFICGGGPSLKKAAPYLHEIKDKGVIFAGGSALGAPIPVHIAAGIDPDPSYERCLMQDNFEAPFFFQSRFSSDLLDLVQGPLVQVPSGLGLRIEESLALDFDGGCTVTTFCSALALYFGCTPIIFVGMDLAYEDEKTKYFQKVAGEDLKAGILYEDQFTQKDWVIASKWIENLAKVHGNTPFYTVSQQGLSLNGIKRIGWTDLLGELIASYDIAGKVQEMKSQVELLDFSLSERLEKVQRIQKSLENSLAIVEEILKLFQDSYPNDPSSQGSFILHLFALYDEIVYQHLLEPLWKVWQFPLERAFSDSYGNEIHRWLFFKRVLQKHLL